MNDLESLLAAKIAVIKQEFLARLKDEWLPNLRTLRQRFQDASADQTLRTELMRAGHNLSGSGAVFGCPDISTVGKQLEHRIRAAENSDMVGSEADRREILAIVDRLDEVCSTALHDNPPTAPQP